MSLIKINDDTGMISIHRLIQEAYLQHLDESQRQETCRIAYQIMCEAFPKRELRRQMYLVWNRCEQLIHHVAALQDRYEELRSLDFDIQDPKFDTLLADVSWYVSVLFYSHLRSVGRLNIKLSVVF